MKKRQADTPELEEEELLKWAERTLFCSQHILYYKKGRSHSSICCSNCGKISYGQFDISDHSPLFFVFIHPEYAYCSHVPDRSCFSLGNIF